MVDVVRVANTYPKLLGRNASSSEACSRARARARLTNGRPEFGGPRTSAYLVPRCCSRRGCHISLGLGLGVGTSTFTLSDYTFAKTRQTGRRHSGNAQTNALLPQSGLAPTNWRFAGTPERWAPRRADFLVTDWSRRVGTAGAQLIHTHTNTRSCTRLHWGRRPQQPRGKCARVNCLVRGLFLLSRRAVVPRRGTSYRAIIIVLSFAKLFVTRHSFSQKSLSINTRVWHILDIIECLNNRIFKGNCVKIAYMNSM